MESPRGANDPSLGGVRAIFPRADLVVLLGRRADFSLGFGRPPLFSPDVRFVAVGPDVARPDLPIALALPADPSAVVASARARLPGRPTGDPGWRAEVVDGDPARPSRLAGAAGGAGRADAPAAPGRGRGPSPLGRRRLRRRRRRVRPVGPGRPGLPRPRPGPGPQRPVRRDRRQHPLRDRRPGRPPAGARGRVPRRRHGRLPPGRARHGRAARPALPGRRRRRRLLERRGPDPARPRRRPARLPADRRHALRPGGGRALGAHAERVEEPAALEAALARALAAGRPALVDVAIRGEPAPTYQPGH